MSGLSDAEVKRIIGKWPYATETLFDSRLWLRLRPAVSPAPYLYYPGARRFSTYSDGLYCAFGLDENAYIEYVDAIAIEASSSIQNFFDKRSRYAFSNQSMMIYCQPQWLIRAVPFKKGEKAISELIGTKHTEDQYIPVRYISVLYVLPNATYTQIRDELYPWPHEYFIPETSLNGLVTNYKAFLPALAPESHFLIERTRRQ
jgi:hypothetical protein